MSQRTPPHTCSTPHFRGSAKIQADKQSKPQCQGRTLRSRSDKYLSYFRRYRPNLSQCSLGSIICRLHYCCTLCTHPHTARTRLPKGAFRFGIFRSCSHRCTSRNRRCIVCRSFGLRSACKSLPCTPRKYRGQSSSLCILSYMTELHSH